MEEISLRFEIIRLAVELGDYETIDIQCGKLRSLSLDDRLNEIIDLLESKNFRQALYEMKHYHQTLEDEFFGEKKAKGKRSGKKEKEEWYEQGLFATEEEDDEEERTLDLEEILRLTEGVTQVPELESEVTEEMEEERAEEGSGSEALSRFPQQEAEEAESGVEEPEEAAFEAVEPPTTWEEERIAEAAENETESLETEPEESLSEATDTEEKSPVEEEEKPAVSETATPAPVKRKRFQPDNAKKSEKKHPPISYIGQKFRNMIHQFPPLERSEVLPPEVERMRKKIAEEGYTEEEIDSFLSHYQDYKKKGMKGEAAQVLLLAAATESKFAQFLLARELFKGEVLQQDHAESFTQINTLADQNFAEAICDLGQFYEYGIGIGKDRQMALLLYEEAAELGVARARKHYERLKNSRGLKGLLGKVKVPKVPIRLPKKTRE